VGEADGMTWWCWLSSKRMTVAVACCGDTIVEGPPIVRRFIGQPIANLDRWMRRQGDYVWYYI
jgi:hypothetical protein